MLQTGYRNLVCKQWDLAYVTQLVQTVFCDCDVAVRSLCVTDQCTGTWCVSSGTWPTSLSSSSLCSVIVVAVRSLCVADCCTGTWCVSSGTWPTSLSSVCVLIVVAVRSLCVVDCVQEPGV